MSENTNPNLDNQALIENKNAILAEKKKLQERLAEREAEFEAFRQGSVRQLQELQNRMEAAEKKVLDYELNYPVARIVGEVATDPKIFNFLLAERYKWVVHENQPRLADLEGNLCMVKDENGKERLLETNWVELGNFLCPDDAKDEWSERMSRYVIGTKASGSGGPDLCNMYRRRGFRQPDTSDQPPPSPAGGGNFGLR